MTCKNLAKLTKKVYFTKPATRKNWPYKKEKIKCVNFENLKL